MKNFILTTFILSSVLLFGAGIPGDLPKPVVRTLNSIFGKDNVELQEKNLYGKPLSGDKFYAVYTADSPRPAGYLHVGNVKTCRAGGCSLPSNSNTDFDGEYFDYLIIFNASAEVEVVRVFNYQASYGHEIAARGWLKQFEGFSGEQPLEAGKNIDAISGATVSVHAITGDVKLKTKMLEKIIYNSESVE